MYPLAQRQDKLKRLGHLRLVEGQTADLSRLHAPCRYNSIAL
jgi:hypothetical protein